MTIQRVWHGFYGQIFNRVQLFVGRAAVLSDQVGPLIRVRVVNTYSLSFVGDLFVYRQSAAQPAPQSGVFHGFLHKPVVRGAKGRGGQARVA